ncbi:YkgJ family cysteine cluster protein [Candidatus Bathyarchaeota archaeon]|nr:YkgJ family cysteine cluster protein [Candidatus Bathyarchaeota archaeon]
MLFLSGRLMVDTFYLHLKFTGKNGGWSINLPFLCNKCGVCCTLDDFLTAGEINAKPEEHFEVHAKMKALSEELGKMWEADEAKYDNYIMHTPCPFLVNNACSIYEIRPDGCRLFPKTAFGMLTEDCEPLTRFKKIRTALKKGRRCIETYHFTGKTLGSAKSDEPIKPAKFTQKQYQTCTTKLRQAGMTDDELNLFNYFNRIEKC